MEGRIARYMVTFPANQWPEAYRRAVEVERVLNGRFGITAAARVAAAHLGYKERNFFKIMRAYKESQKFEEQVLARPRGSALSTKTSSALEEIIGREGSRGRPTAILHAAKALCLERVIPAPSRKAIRNRLNVQPATPDIVARTGHDKDIAIDMSPLDLLVENYQGKRSLAVLTGVIEISTAKVIAHIVTADRPTGYDLAHLMAQAARLRGSARSPSVSLVAYRDAPIHTPGIKSSLAHLGVDLASIQEDGRRPGQRLTATIGLRLGRVPLQPRHDASNPVEDRESLNIAVVRPPVALLIERNNDLRRGKRGPPPLR